MIQQILSKSLLQDLAEALLEEATATPEDRRSGEPTPMDDFNADQRNQLMGALELAQREFADSGGPSLDERRGEAELSIQDARAYMARSPEVSNLQSAAECYYRDKRPDVVEESHDDDRRGETPTLAGARLRNLPDLEDRRLFGKFEQTDLRWIGSLLSEGLRKYHGRRPFVSRPVRRQPIMLPDENLRLIIVGDWGSGIPRAQKIGALMRRELASPKIRGWQRHVVHLGDVYYSGWKYEYRDRFLKFWPVKLEEKDTIGSFNLNGNHDMYSGGWDYFDFALADKRFALWQGTSSLFSLANKSWQLFGMDTSYADAALAGDQPAWIRESALPGRKTVLLSHHQFCSSFEKPATAMVDALKPIMEELDVAAWLWGHEHRCMTFQEVSGIRYPACIGHGGVPVYQAHNAAVPIPSPGAWEYRDCVDSGFERWAKFGFVTLDFFGDKIRVRYINEDGDVHRTDTIV